MKFKDYINPNTKENKIYCAVVLQATNQLKNYNIIIPIMIKL